MKPVIFIVLIVIVQLLIANSCKKPSKCTATGGGKGGNATLAITPEHANLFVDSCTIYIKYGAVDAPANGVYDDSQVCNVVNDTPLAVFHGLKAGVYYVFGKGYHPAVPPPNVKGGESWTMCIEDSERAYILVGSYTP